ncbi:MAG: hypothetical protein ACUVXB_07410 [Bryobacteraceae bacterium]
MKTWTRRGWFFCWAGICLPRLRAQIVISARSGLIQYFERSVFLNEAPLVRTPNRFAQMEPYDVLRSANGRAEVLVRPDVFLRIREHSSVRLLSDALMEPRYELLSGSMILEAQEMPAQASVQVLWRDRTIAVSKRAIWRLDSATGNLRVIEGEVSVLYDGKPHRLRRGRWLSLKDDLTAGRFDRTLGDSFDIWSARRSQMLAAQAMRQMRGARPFRRPPRAYSASAPTMP